MADKVLIEKILNKNFELISQLFDKLAIKHPNMWKPTIEGLMNNTMIVIPICPNSRGKIVIDVFSGFIYSKDIKDKYNSLITFGHLFEMDDFVDRSVSDSGFCDSPLFYDNNQSIEPNNQNFENIQKNLTQRLLSFCPIAPNVNVKS